MKTKDDIEDYMENDGMFQDEIDYTAGSLDPPIYDCDGACLAALAKGRQSN